MKSLLNALFFSLLILSSCVAKDEPVEPETPDQETPEAQDTTATVNREGLYSCDLPSSTQNGKTSWVAGDQLVIHGEYTSDQSVVTLTAADISEDGKTCYVSVDGITPFVQKTTKARYYIAYPGELVANESHCKDMSKFKGTNAILLAGYNNGETFELSTLVGGYTFTVSGDFDSYELRGNNEETVGYGSLTAKITDGAKMYAQAKGNELKVISGKLVADGSTLNHICLSGDVVLLDGFLMTLFKDGEAVKTLYHVEECTSGRDVFTSLGDITSKLIDYKSPAADSHVSSIPTANAKNLCANETANCYVVYQPGIYSFKAVKGNSSEDLPSIGSVEVLWETWGTDEAVTKNSVVSAVDFEKDQIYFQVAEDFHPGNAVIAVRNDMGVIMWSWHIWIPETPITEDLYHLSNYLTMDRNLGALVAASVNGAEPKSAGLFYQWGRKDPFVGVGSFSTGDAAKVAGEERSLFGGQLTMAKAIKNPTAFGDYEGNWNPISYEDLWASKKTKYDPCPPGYKVPYRSQNVLFTNSPGEMDGWKFDPNNYLFTAGVPNAVYPLAGWMSWDGSYQYTGKGAGVWSSRASSTESNGYCFRLYNDGSKTSYSSSSRGKAYGFAVRCVSYTEVPFENALGTPVQGSYKRFSADVQELSGLCLNTDGSFIWGVGDQGNLIKITFDGKVENVMKQGLDMEAITIDPATNDLYLGLEANHVYKIAAPDYKKAVRVFDVEDAADYGNSGVEGIAWYKDGMILVGTQTGAYMWAYKLDGTVVWKKSLRSVAIGMQEIADICYDPVKDQLWIIDSVTQCIYLFNGDATQHLATYDVSYGGNCESVCLDVANSCVWIADDDTQSVLMKIDFTF